ncbi:MAG: M56 family metallopeptidase [Muribaculaceae bacterium]|nr:M56 family metallopeptidase [Muribaculaceae bacterium]
MLLIYQIKVGICLIAFYLVWKLLLSRETFHRFNRVALLMVMAIALVLPWIKVTLDSPVQTAAPIIVLQELLVGPADAGQSVQAAHSWSVLDIANAFYFIGMAAVLFWLLHSQWNLRRIFRQGRSESLPGGITLHVVPGDVSPFSYFNHIVINEQDYRDNPREILIHEQAHINLRHSIDVVFTSLVTLFQWWNPAAWLLCRELRQVHEYEADEAVINENVDVKQYQLLLIRKSVGDQLFSMANSFNYQSLKKRIRMMTINKSSRWNKLRALAAVPVIALALLAFANPETDTAELVVVAYQQDKTESDQVYKSVEQMPQFPGGEAAMMRYLSQNIKYPPSAAKNNIEGRVILQFVVEKDGQIGEVKIVRSVDPELDAEAVRVIKTMPNFIPGRQDGKPVAVWYTIPISFKLQGKPEQTQQPE